MSIVPADTIISEFHTLLDEYEQFLSVKAQGTIDAYLRTVRHLMGWVANLPGNAGQFQPQQLTSQTVEQYLTHLEQEGFSLNHRMRVKSSISTFANFLIEEKWLLQRNPTRNIKLPPVESFASQQLSREQRFILRSLVKQAGDQRGAALFALGYWTGCRVNELSWLRMEHAHVDAHAGWLHLSKKEGRERNIDLIEQARRPLCAYLQATGDSERTYVFISQRSERLTEEGIYYWFRMLKAQAATDQQEMIEGLTFNDLRHDFARRARRAGCSQQEVAYYLGNGGEQGVYAPQTIAASTQVSQEHIKRKLNDIKG
jgi:site-specific recombinase XerD